MRYGFTIDFDTFNGWKGITMSEVSYPLVRHINKRRFELGLSVEDIKLFRDRLATYTNRAEVEGYLLQCLDRLIPLYNPKHAIILNLINELTQVLQES